MLPIRGKRQRTCIVPSCRQIQKVLLFAEAFRGLRVIAKAQELIRVSDVNVVLVEGNAKWPLDFVRTRVGQKNVPIRRYRKPPRPLEVLRKKIHAKALRHRRKESGGRLHPFWPVTGGFGGKGRWQFRLLPVSHLPRQYGCDPKSDG